MNYKKMIASSLLIVACAGMTAEEPAKHDGQQRVLGQEFVNTSHSEEEKIASKSTAKKDHTFEQDRIIYEGTMETLRILYHSMSHTDPILRRLADKWHIPLTFGNFLK